MRLIVTVLLIAIVLGAVAIQIKANTIVWQLNVDNWKRLPRWQARVWLGIVIAVVIIGLILDSQYPGR